MGGALTEKWRQYTGFQTVARPVSPQKPPVSYTNSLQTEAQNDASWLSQAGDWASTAWSSAADWTVDNWDTIYNVGTVVGLGICVFATAGACLVAGGVLLLGNIVVDVYKNQDDLSQVDVTGHVTDAAMLAAVGIIGRTVAGSARRFWTDQGMSRISHYQKRPPQRSLGDLDVGSSMFVYGANATQWVIPQGVSSGAKWMYGDMGM